MNMLVENKLAPTSVNKIERIHKPTLEEFKHATRSYRQPVIITGEIADWKAFALWSIDYLNNVVGKKEVYVSVAKNKIFTFDLENEVIMPNIKIQFTDFTNWIIEEKKDDQDYYLQQNPIKIAFPELLPDIEIPDYIDKKSFMVTNLWIGTDGNISTLHWDLAQNFLCQVRGRKRILLFEPKQTSFLYPFSVDSKMLHVSQVNIDKPNIDKFPKFQKSKYIECMLEPGEMLYIPTCWWHQVYSLEQLNIAVNFWWKPNFQDCFRAQGRRILLQRPHKFLEFILNTVFKDLSVET